MTPRVENIYKGLPGSIGLEQFLTLFENGSVKIERIASRSHSSPPGFWYDQTQDEWVIALRGQATIEFEGGEFVEMEEGDHLAIPSRVKHRVERTGPDTLWLAVHIKKAREAK
jgi:cupin 2 domain-containing protein